ncbi:MAG: hypothetical protein M3R62_05205 [Acidobacteriota bacterium]|nr:hypothetical protein [Acidobacteriota bacterium]MDQ2978595.1 hypothetical protein [Acidobacteriota bacterium]
MKRIIALVGVCFLFSLGSALAQEHWTEGPVWSVSFYRTTPGHFDDYMKYLRTNYAATTAESKKEGLILDSKIFVKVPSGATDWDVCIASLYSSYGKALDYNKGDDDKSKAIQSKHWKTPDLDKQRQLSASRLEARTFLGTQFVREVTLRPMQ